MKWSLLFPFAEEETRGVFLPPRFFVSFRKGFDYSVIGASFNKLIYSILSLLNRPCVGVDRVFIDDLLYPRNNAAKSDQI